MPHRARVQDDDVSLFPFLSIIACVIGVLTMMIATLSLAQTDTPDVAQVEQYEQLQKDLAKAETQIQTAKLEIDVSSSTSLKVREEKKLLDVTLSELEAMLAEQERIEKELAQQQQVKIVIPELDQAARETATQMNSQWQQLQEELAQLESEFAKRTDVATEANVTVLPQGCGLDFVPRFVECADGAVVMHHLQPPKQIRAAEIASDSDFIALLEHTLNSKRDSIVFLVRSDGLATYHACKQMCDSRSIRNGKIPVVGKGRIDLSAFAGAGKP